MEMISNAWYSMEGTPMVSHGMGYMDGYMGLNR
jgi:hypothetical protein